MSTARTVPPDVIHEILSYVAPPLTLTGTDSGYDRETYNTPWELALISRMWRQCALGSRNLWTCLTLDSAEVDFPYYSDSILDRLECQLERSGKKKLNVGLSGSEPFKALRVSPALLASCDRWDTLALRVDSNTSFDDLALADGKFAALRRLEFVCDGDELESTPDEFSNAPSLREVILTDEDFEFPSFNLDLSWEQITHLRGFFDSHQSFLDIVEEAVNLVDLALHIDPNAPAFATTVPLPLAQLRRLYVHSSKCLSSFTAPALHELTCTTAAPLTLRSFCVRSAILSSLRSLVLVNFDGPPDQLWMILIEFTALTDLAVDSASWPVRPVPGVWTPLSVENCLFHGLAAAPSIKVCCPNLESFVYRCVVLDTEDDLDVFFNMVRSRSHTHSPPDDYPWRRLCHVRLHWRFGLHTLTSASEDNIRDIKSEGVDLELIPPVSADDFKKSLRQ
ncbi:hypothetical protein GGX14DRAFT_453716 [Mycena pura]|uniref:F-box domain-containing protein n=1 Tax=Mycena pura TaxID=153505 RepID=A0AAD6VGA0_9AGAR|nr:hypothetical protein GGX14DRAFT_453716 [Mycena pura]